MHHTPTLRAWTFTFRRLLLVVALTCGFASTALAEIGLNFNGTLSLIDHGDLTRAHASMVRGFVDYYQFRSGAKNLATDPGIAAFRTAYLAGFKTVLSLKLDFTGKSFPTTPAAIDTELNYVHTLLAAVYPYSDIIVIGNEPFIESIPAERDVRLVNFYKALAQKVKVYKDAQTRKVPLYLGAFNRLWETSWQTPATASLLLYVKNNSAWLAGIDLHIHHSATSDINGAFNYASPKIASNQKILVTEFSLMHHWKAHLTDTIPAQLASQYGRPASWQVWQYLAYALNNPVSRPEWVVFLQNSPWFENRKNYITNAYGIFTLYPKFELCTYACYQTFNGTFTATTDPWILNAIYVNRTVVLNPTTNLFQTNYSFFDTFKALQ